MTLDEPVHRQPWWTLATARHATVVEIAALAVILPEVLALLSPRLAEAVVPLFILVPILFGMRYGFSAGVAAAILLGAVFFHLHYYAPHALARFPQVQVALNLVAGFIAGQFHDHWTRRLRDASELAANDRRRLAQFTNTFHILKASHAILERQLAGNRTSLRCALQRLSVQLAGRAPDARPPLEEVGPCLLELLAESCHLHAGAVYAINERGMLVPTALVSYGSAAPLSPFNPLLRQALDSASAVSIRANDTSVDHIIAVVPLVDSFGRIHGVASINQMSFIAIEQHTFDLMAIIARRVGDILSGHACVFGSLADTRDLAVRFRQNAAIALAQQMALALVVVRIVDPAGTAEVIVQCLQVQRGIDQPWMCHDRKGRPVLVMFLPMPDEDCARGVEQRMRSQLRLADSAQGRGDLAHSAVRMLDAAISVEEALGLALMLCDLGESNGQVQPLSRYPELTS